MALQFQCSSCGTPVAVRFLRSGEMAKCPNCGVLVRVPDDANQIADAEVAPSVAIHQVPPEDLSNTNPNVRVPVPLTDREEARLRSAQKLVKYGVAAGAIDATLTFVLVTLALLTNSQKLAELHEPLMYVDAVVEVGLVYGLYRRSRFSAVLLFGYFLINLFAAAGQWRLVDDGILLRLVVGSLFAGAALGTFAVHRLLKKAGRVPRQPSPMLVVALSILVLLYFLLGIIGLMGGQG